MKCLDTGVTNVFLLFLPLVKFFLDPISTGSISFSNVLFVAFSIMYKVNYIVNITG